jgi:Holliday junction resolvasome RuvABC ATP-dependent DNA helicase subunit
VFWSVRLKHLPQPGPYELVDPYAVSLMAVLDAQRFAKECKHTARTRRRVVRRVRGAATRRDEVAIHGIMSHRGLPSVRVVEPSMDRRGPEKINKWYPESEHRGSVAS